MTVRYAKWLMAAVVVGSACAVWASEPADGGAAGDSAAVDNVAEVEAQLIDQKLNLARAYRYRGRRAEAFKLVREALAIRPTERRVVQLAVGLWLDGWDEEIVKHLDEAPDKVVLEPLDKYVDAVAVGGALIDELGRRDDVQHPADVTLIAPYVRPEHAEALAKLVDESGQGTAVVAASLLSILGDERGDTYIAELLTQAPGNRIQWSPVSLLAYAAPSVWAKVAERQNGYVARPAALNLGYAGDDSVRELLETLAESNQMVVQDAAITALIGIGARDEAATALGKYRMRYWRGMASGGIGHKLLVSYALLGDEEHFFELYDGFPEDLRSAVARMLAAQMHMAAGRGDKAVETIQPVVEEVEGKVRAEPERADAYYQVAYTIGVAGIDPERAKQMAFAALEHHPSADLRPQVYALLAELYLDEKKLEQARVAADAAASLYSMEHPRYAGLQRRAEAAREAAADAQ